MTIRASERSVFCCASSGNTVHKRLSSIRFAGTPRGGGRWLALG